MSKQQILGRFVHRAVAMPFIKRQKLLADSQGQKRLGSTCNNVPREDGESIQEAIAWSAKVLRRAMRRASRSNGSITGLSDLEKLVDEGGRWWPELAQLYCGLPAEDQEWVRERIMPVANSVADWLNKYSHAQEDDWQWVWSEYSLPGWDSNVPTRERIDLVVGLDPKEGEILLLDLKTIPTRSRITDPRRSKSNSKQLNKYRKQFAAQFNSAQQPGKISCELLYVETGNKNPECISVRID